MAKISILTCANATQDLGCSSASCLANFRKRKGTFAEYPEDEKLTLAGIINCPGCPTLTGPDKLIGRIRAITDFGVDTIHFSYCVKALCLFKEKYKDALCAAESSGRRCPPYPRRSGDGRRTLRRQNDGIESRLRAVLGKS